MLPGWMGCVLGLSIQLYTNFQPPAVHLQATQNPEKSEANITLPHTFLYPELHFPGLLFFCTSSVLYVFALPYMGGLLQVPGLLYTN